MIRDWNNWTWLGGDHVVEQHVHNLDVMNWVMGTHPISVVAMGARHRRITGNQYDCFCSDFTFPGEIHWLSQARQINGCANEVSERVTGEKGVSNCNGWISTIKLPKLQGRNPYVQEHADLIASIRARQPLNEAQAVAESTLTGIMARMSAYTGQQITWDAVMKSDLVLGPPDYPLTDGAIRAHIPVPGISQ
jgi:myo-inositol 2-dehydrogenase / D-chiro-inositol 1-dehydrogenase